jgi:hypothetical protein
MVNRSDLHVGVKHALTPHDIKLPKGKRNTEQIQHTHDNTKKHHETKAIAQD